MGIFSRFEDKAEDLIEGSGSSRDGGIEPVKLAKRAYKEMQREKMVGVGHEYAPTLYNVLLSPEDDERMNGMYPSLAGEIETYLTGRAEGSGLVFDCPPLVRFIVDDGLKRSRFDIIAESVSPSIIEELRREEMEHYGISRPAEHGAQVAGELQPLEPYGMAGRDDDGHADRAHAPFDPLSPADMQEGDYAPAAHPQPAAARDPHPQPAAAQARPRPAAAQPETNPEAVRRERSAVRSYLYDHKTQQRFALELQRVVIGREVSCTIQLADPSVSRHHAEMLCGPDGWTVRDTGSTNGTSVNGTPVTQSRVYNGDTIKLGNTQLQFQED